MQVRSGDAPCGAHKTEDRAGLDYLADRDVDCGKMPIKSVEAQAVVQDDGIPGKI